MSTKLPIVVAEADGSFRLQISADTVLHWHFENDGLGTLCKMTIEDRATQCG
jgi:hypothetical protein